MTDFNDFGRTSFVTHTTGLKERMEKCTMTNHLFKLKKDGKTVGYLKIEDGHIYYRYPMRDWICNKIEFETAHPFVTKDKNGKDVFEGDRLRRVNYTGDPEPREVAGQEGIVVWHHGFLQWSLKVGSENSYLLNDLVDSEIFEAGIELIEDKDNE